MKPIQAPICLASLMMFAGNGFLHGQDAGSLQTPQAQQGAEAEQPPWQTGAFRWRVSPPLLAIDQQHLPDDSPEHPWLAVKDPSIIRYQGRWHCFCTLRRQQEGDGRIRIGYLSFENWQDAQSSDWHLLQLTEGYHGAPQIFYFEPQRKWYLIYQAADSTRNLKYGPCYSTNSDLSRPQDWTLPEPLYVVPDGVRAGLDFWVICDDLRAHLFFTSLDGQMWRADTDLKQFPSSGWSTPEVALKADIFEASHTYRLPNLNKYFTIVEAQAGRRRYFKGYVADRLDGKWTPIADSQAKPLVSPVNVVNQQQSWAMSYSHGEFLRAGYDQRLELDTTQPLQLLFQGASDDEYQIGNYGDIPWRLGLLTQE
ncbi:MAG: hypothetical protein KDB22_09070 [Planctomycetales bacterium]|nr:hypothetical protein [Planctomycetales bacterium]